MARPMRSVCAAIAVATLGLGGVWGAEPAAACTCDGGGGGGGGGSGVRQRYDFVGKARRRVDRKRDPSIVEVWSMDVVSSRHPEPPDRVKVRVTVSAGGSQGSCGGGVQIRTGGLYGIIGRERDDGTVDAAFDMCSGARHKEVAAPPPGARAPFAPLGVEMPRWLPVAALAANLAALLVAVALAQAARRRSTRH